MRSFVYPYQFNVLRRELRKLLHVVYFVGDHDVYSATKSSLEETIHSLFGPLDGDEARLFEGITQIQDQRQLNDFMVQLREYVIPFQVEESDILRLFKKEKKLSLPDIASMDAKSMTYLGWRDISKNQLYLVYPYQGKLTGIRARYTSGTTAKSNVCCLCNEAMKGTEVGLVVARTQRTEYQSVGNYMCLDSDACNRRLTNVHAIDDFFARALAK